MRNDNVEEKYVDVNGVRITPSKLILVNTYALKEVTGKFVIQNVGKCMVLIRIFPPTEKECYVEPIKAPKSLPVGLRISRTVRFHAVGIAGSTCVVPIYINDDRYNYEIELCSQKNQFTIIPSRIDLGVIPVGLINRAPGITIQNYVMHAYKFFVEVAKCDVVIIAEPHKGCLTGLGTVDITIKVISLHEADFCTSICIKCAEITTVIPITGSVIYSKLEAMHMNTTEFFTLITFPPTYFGLKSVQNLYVRNRCTMQKMFSSAEEVTKTTNKHDIDSFRIQPSEGYFQPNETKLFQFTFTPIRRPGRKNTKDDFYFSSVLIHKFQCRNLHIYTSLTNYFELDREPLKEPASLSEKRDTLTTYRSSLNLPTEDTDSITHEDEKLYYDSSKASRSEFTRVYLYATAEEPSVQVCPDQLIVNDVLMHTKQTRVLELRNKSKKLPIVFHYKKTAFVSLKATDIYLNPNESVQISVDICPQSLGAIQSKVVFQLMYYDQPKSGRSKILGKVVIPITVGITTTSTLPKPLLNLGLTPNYIKDVGKHCQEVKFDTVLPTAKIITVYNSTAIDEQCSDLVAFPNDTQQSLRPWRSETPCRTIFAKLPRYQPIIDSDYERTAFDLQLKRHMTDYYSQFLRKSNFLRMPTHGEVASEYSLTEYKKIMCRECQFANMRCSPTTTISSKHSYIPLTPKQLEKIVVCPRLVDSGQVAVNDVSLISITVTNGNPFPIRMFIKVDKLCLSIEKNRCVLQENQSYTIELRYQSSNKGYHTSLIDLVINESMVLYVPLLAEVVPKMLHVSTTELEFDDYHPLRYIDVKNKLGVPVDFQWLVASTNFIVRPEYGKVNAHRYITCSLRYAYNINGSVEKNIVFYSGDDIKTIVKLKVTTKAKNIILPELGVAFDNVSLNKLTLRWILIKNPNSVPMTFSFDENQFEKNISIFPISGVIPPASDIGVYLAAKFTNCVKFDGYAMITIPCGQTKLRISGNVVYPNIQVVPKILNLPKVPASSTSELSFVVQNNSVASASIHFDMAEFLDYRITSSLSLTDDSNVDTLVIDSNCSKQLYIHFIPAYESSCVFYLPMIINEILGPPVYTDVVSTYSNYYLTDNIDNAVYIETPTHLPFVKVKSLAMSPKILISKVRITMTSTPKRRECEQEVLISNPQTFTERVWIAIDKVIQPFSVDCPDTDTVEKTGRGIVCILDHDKSVTLTISFDSNELEFGLYNLVLRIFLASDQSKEPHTAICVQGNYKRPDISVHLDTPNALHQQFRVDTTCIRYGRMFPPINIPIRYSRILVCKNHLPNCQITTECSMDDFEAIIDHETKQVIDEDTYTIQLTVTWRPVVPVTYLSPWKVTCDCGGLWVQHISRIVENSFLTTSVFSQTHFTGIAFSPKQEIMVNENKRLPEFFSSYPFYPMTDSPEKTFLDTCISLIEKWIHTQLTYGETLHHIPYTICRLDCVPVTEEHVKRQTKTTTCLLAQFLITLVGPRVREILELKPEKDIPEDGLSRTEYLLGVYWRAINFLKENGASFTYLRSEYLLPFSLYTLFKQKLYDEDTPPYTLTKYITSINEFCGIAKHSWMDVFLQSYKVFVVNRLYNDYKAMKSNNSIPQNESPISYFLISYDHVNKCPSFFSDSESYLFSWLEYTFNTSSNKVWGRHFEEKTVSLFDGNMKDGIIFATVTLVYCPYLLPHLQNMYFDDCTAEETMHNASTLVRTWQMVNCSFDLDAELICNPNAMAILMLTAYLYEVLPNMYPSDTLSFDAGLSQTAKDYVQIHNQNDFPIAYKPILISQNECFKIYPNTTVVIHPKKTIEITITYFAKFAKQATATLLLSGEIKKYRYAKNKCIALIGNPILTYANTTIKVSLSLFSVSDINVIIKSPYTTAAVYDLQLVTHMIITDPEELSKVAYHYQRDRLSARRLMLSSKRFEFNEDGVCLLKGMLFCLGNYSFDIWLYFRNKEVGDFCVKFITIIQESLEREVLPVVLTDDILKQTKANKSKTIYVEIPYRNSLLVKTARMYLIWRTEGEERALWERIVDTAMGVNILQRLLMIEMPNSTVPNVLHCISGEYQVTTSKTGGILFPETVTFPEECSSTFLKVPLQLVNPAAIPPQVVMTLESKKLLRKRVYVVRFENAPSDFIE